MDQQINGSDDLLAAEDLIMRWDPTTASSTDDHHHHHHHHHHHNHNHCMIFDGEHRTDADRYLRAVDLIRRSLESSASGSPRKRTAAMQVAMARLEDEFRHILVNQSVPIELELDSSDLSLSFNSLSLSSSGTCSFHVGAGSSRRGGRGDDGDGGDQEQEEEEEEEEQEPGVDVYRSASSLRDIDVLPPNAIADLRSIAGRMSSAGYHRELVQAYTATRRPATESALRALIGPERLSIADYHRLDWSELERRIRRWIRAAPPAVRLVFAAERRLASLLFAGSASSTEDAAFSETTRGPANQLFGFAETVSIGRRSTEKLFKVLDLHDCLSGLLPDISAVFDTPSTESVRTQAAETLARLAEAVRGILAEFENAVDQESSNPVPNGTVHPLTRYVMNYISLISDYKQTLFDLILTGPTIAAANSADPDEDSDHQRPPLAAHLVYIIATLQTNLENKASHYPDPSLGHLSIMNNVHYIVNKIRDSPELRELIEDGYLKRLTGRYRQSATMYQRAAWVRILHCLRDEGIHVSGSFSSGISRSVLRERFKSFNAAFEEAHRVQSGWVVPDVQLKEELRISIMERLLPAYRSFLGRFRHHIESGRHPEAYIKYSVEDLEAALSDFFEGTSPSLLSRRRSH
ncbi:hypothetical protein QJS10_CPA06g02525 [Acorus calamus]|uniref:Exocyst subunit Exo70 family protein n=1 Tax=Acorus calamus TaxID=4465 RepID=A0AAV9EN64_ACOCL|nr:hypothetical protein QJS10_CPA06g02525 [Acorus calamus]